MAIDTAIVQRQALTLAGSIGEVARHSLFPRDFEYYALSLELTDSGNNLIDYFTFPILPKNISKTESSRVNIKKSLTSINVINSKSLQPQDITIKGNFGRAFKILVSSNVAVTFKGLRYSQKAGVYNALETGNESNIKDKKKEFNFAVKSGYGCTKILQSIVDKARGVDAQGKPYRLYLYNPIMGENYLVVPSQTPLILSTDDSNSNRLFEYTLNLTIIAPLEYVVKKSLNGSYATLLSADLMQKSVNSTASNIKLLL